MSISLLLFKTETMKQETKNKLFEAWTYCNEHDKSTEFMLEYMQDFANVDLDCVIAFLKNSEKQRKEWYNKQKP